MKKTGIVFTLLLLIALAGGLLLLNRNQDLRKGASFATTVLNVVPGEKQTKKIGDILSYQVQYATTGSAKADGVQTIVCYGPQIEIAETKDENGTVILDIMGNTAAGFGKIPITSAKKIDETKSCVTVVVTSQEAASKLLSASNAFKINFKAIKVGSGTITLDKANSVVTGDNPASATDKEIAVSAVQNGSYEIVGETVISPPPAAGVDPVLNYMVAYRGIRPNDHKCMVNWPMELVVLSRGVTQVYENIIPSEIIDGEKGVSLKGSVALKGFTYTDQIAVFFKGPKHLQMKYAVQNQSSNYDRAGGQLVLTKDPATSIWYDFTAHPMLPGDVVGEKSQDQDGDINGLDFIYVKNEVLKLTTIEAGSNLKADLDGNCQANSNDVNLLTLSLKDKQGQLY